MISSQNVVMLNISYNSSGTRAGINSSNNNSVELLRTSSEILCFILGFIKSGCVCVCLND